MVWKMKSRDVEDDGGEKATKEEKNTKPNKKTRKPQR